MTDLSNNNISLKDVYETEDLPEVDQIFDESDDKGIDIINISHSMALERFKGKKMQVPRQMSKKNKAKLESINPIMKSERIRNELISLKKTVETMNEADKVTEKDPVSKQQLLLLIDGLTSQLEEMNVAKELENVDLEIIDKENLIFKKLQKSIKEVQSRKAVSGGVLDDQPKVSSYAIVGHKPLNDLANESKLTALTRRTDDLERALGNDSLKLAAVVASGVSGGGVLGVLDRMTAKTGLLHGPQLSVVEARLGSVAARLQSIQTVAAAATELDPEASTKVAELFELVKKWDGVVDSLPRIIENCRAMEDHHEQCAKMSKCVDNLNGKQQEIASKMEYDKMALNNLTKQMPENFRTMEQNVRSLEERLAKLK